MSTPEHARTHVHDRLLASNQILSDNASAAVNELIAAFNSRAKYFADSFIKKIKEGNKKALAELAQGAIPPTLMDLRPFVNKCISTGVHEAYVVVLNDGKQFALRDLSMRVTEWALTAEKALMESDPMLADKLMSIVQWNAKTAFEVTFTSAMNELTELKKKKQRTGDFEHYRKWIIAPLLQSVAEIKKIQPPSNALIGYGKRIPLSQALIMAEALESEFRKLL